MARSSGGGLQRDAVGLMSVLFMSVTDMAPGAAVAWPPGPCLLHLAIPLVGALALTPVLLAAFWIDFAHLGITGLTYPADLAPFICLAWMVLGLGVLGYFGDPGPVPDRRHPSRLHRTNPRRARVRSGKCQW